MLQFCYISPVFFPYNITATNNYVEYALRQKVYIYEKSHKNLKMNTFPDVLSVIKLVDKVILYVYFLLNGVLAAVS